MPGRTDRRLRMVTMLLIFVVFGSAAMVRLGYWQVVAAPELAQQAERTIAKPPVPKPPRAEIIDRHGVVLAQSATLDQLDVHPDQVPADKRDDIVRTLADILDVRSSATRKEWAAKLASGKQWEWLKRSITLEQSVDIGLAKGNGELPGIVLEPHDVRVYPRKGGQDGTTLASQLLGFVNAGGRGTYGIEQTYDDRLSGADTPVDLATVAGATDLGTPTELPPLTLTIDAGLQRQVEKELFSARLATHAKSVSAIVMDPYTGAILASASVPGYDANDFADVAQKSPGRFRDRNVSDFYEPGSVMKIFTAGAALEAGVVTPNTRIRDEVKLRFYTDVIQNSDHRSLGVLRVKDAIALSRNNVAAKIAERLAPKDHQKAARKLYAFWKKVGVAGKTGVDIANESAGLGYDPKQYTWAPVDLANRSFGQGVAVTLMQLARGVATLVNGGYRIQPHVVANGELASVEPVRVIPPKVARQTLQILQYVTGSVPWYAKGSLIPGYMVGGKTGTAQIWDSAKGTWKDNIFNHSFIGFIGDDRPEAVIVVRLEEPKVKVHDQGVIESKVESYELYRMVALAAIKQLDIPKSKDRNAGLPIIGTAAARQLTPTRDRIGRQRARQRAAQRAKAGNAQQPKAAKTKKSARTTSQRARRAASTTDS